MLARAAGRNTSALIDSKIQFVVDTHTLCWPALLSQGRNFTTNEPLLSMMADWRRQKSCCGFISTTSFITLLLVIVRLWWPAPRKLSLQIRFSARTCLFALVLFTLPIELSDNWPFASSGGCLSQSSSFHVWCLCVWRRGSGTAAASSSCLSVWPLIGGQCVCSTRGGEREQSR